jgi:hypothetical protein
VDSSIPKCNDVDKRELSIPPNAPPPSRKGGTNTNKPLMIKNWSIRAFINNPDPVLKQADITRMKKLSLIIFTGSGGLVLNKENVHPTQVITMTAKITYFATSKRAATNKQGNVIKSPTDVIKGAVTLSGSHPLEKLWKATSKVNPRMNTLEINPPMTEITTRSTTDMDENPNTKAVIRDNTPSKTETVNVSTREAATFPVITGDLVKRAISPTCNAVLIREPNDAKIFPRIPMAAGIIITIPGRYSNISENVPKYIPPTSEPKEANTKESIPCLKTAARADKNSRLLTREMVARFFSFIDFFNCLIIVVP